MRLLAIIFLLIASPCPAWNALGHKVIAEIAWQQLRPSERKQIVEILRRHPRFDTDFAGKMTDDVLSADKSLQDQWIFQHAATWPDLIRNNKEYDQPTWHYINIPIFVDGERDVSVNTSMEYPTSIDRNQFNVAQATKHCLAAIKSKAGPDVKALAYCWLFHLVGDMHQPMHSTALFSGHFPNGDRGGNSIPLTRGKNLHSLWDNLLGRQHYLRNVHREVAELRNLDWSAEQGNVNQWVMESHEIAKTTAYDPIILDAVRKVNGDLLPIELSETYRQEAGRVARHRIIAAGIRLSETLKGN
jgi:S1/P1 Nuclease